MTLTTQPINDTVDLIDGYGQQSYSFRFTLINGLTGGPIGELTPLRTGTLSHDTGRTIKRSLNLSLGAVDTAAINPISDRIDVTMLINGVEYPLGRYVFASDPRRRYTSGSLANVSLVDEMYIIDQEIEQGINARGRNCAAVIATILADYDIEYTIDATDFLSAEAWGPGTRRGVILSALAASGDYFTPWVTSRRVLTFLRTFDPADEVPAFNLDAGHQVYRDGITETNDLLTAPNRFVVISNAADDNQSPVFASADVATSAPHSVSNRGFVIPKTYDLQVTTTAQAAAIARQLAITSSVLEYTNIVTAPDPRHESYDVIFWDGQLWLETAWSIQLGESAPMSHTLQKVYS